MHTKTLSTKPLSLLPLAGTFFYVLTALCIQRIRAYPSLTTTVSFYLAFRLFLSLKSSFFREKPRFQHHFFLTSFLMSFIVTGFPYIFFIGLRTTDPFPVLLTVLCFPLWIPWILKLWIVKRMDPTSLLSFFLFGTGWLLLFFFSLHFALILALCASLLKGIAVTGYKRLSLSGPPFHLFLFYRLVPFLISLPLLTYSFTKPSVSDISAIFCVALSEHLAIKCLRKDFRFPLFYVLLFSVSLSAFFLQKASFPRIGSLFILFSGMYIYLRTKSHLIGRFFPF